MRTLTKSQILQLHSSLIHHFGGMDGVRDENLLESALYAPFASFDGKFLYPSIQSKAAQLAFGLIRNHPFLDGNKRIGALMTQLLLKWNGYKIALQKNELADMFIAIADGKADEDVLLKWIRNHLC